MSKTDGDVRGLLRDEVGMAVATFGLLAQLVLVVAAFALGLVVFSRITGCRLDDPLRLRESGQTIRRVSSPPVVVPDQGEY